MGTGNKDIVVKKYLLRCIRHALEECVVLTEELEDIEKRCENFPLHIQCLGLIQYIGELTREASE
jgi:hypothetical protein